MKKAAVVTHRVTSSPAAGRQLSSSHFLHAAFTGDLESVKQQLEDGSGDVYKVNDEGATALMLACGSGHNAVVQV